MADIPFDALVGSGGYIFKTTITTSGTWTVPAGVSKIKILATGGGGGGGGSITGDGPTPGQGGTAGGTAISEIDVVAGSVLNITIGAGGAGGVTANGTSGGDTIVRSGFSVVAVGSGGFFGAKNNNLTNTASGYRSLNSEGLLGGAGGAGGNTSAVAPGGSYSVAAGTYSTSLIQYAGVTASNGGTGGTVTGGGGGGGASRYGIGGVGGNGVNSNIVGLNGAAPLAGCHGAGGGGAGGSNGAGGANGGAGLSGAVEILY